MDNQDKKQQIIVKICCVIAAFGLWLYTTSVINPVRTYKKDIPVTVINEEVLKDYKLVLVPGQKLYLTLTLKGPVKDIYSVKEEQFKLVMDLKEYVLRKGENNIPVRVERSPRNIKIDNSDNLWIKVVLDELVKKDVTLKVKLKGKPKSGYYPMSPQTNTSMVTIEGASRDVNIAYSAETDVDISNAERDLNGKFPIKIIDVDGNIINGLDMEPKFAKVNVPIKKAKTVGINIITKENLNENVRNLISVSPNKIDIVGEESVVNNIKSIDTEPIDLSDVNNDELSIKLNVPNGVTLVNNNGYVKAKVSLNSNKTYNLVNKNINLKIKQINLEDNLNAILENNKVSVIISGNEDLINKLDLNSISCYVDLSSLKEGQHNLPIKIELPEGIKVLSISPEKVNVNIKSNQILEGDNVSKSK